MLVEILTDTMLQRTLDEDVFGRAYGLALPASIGGIVAGSAVAPLLASLLGTSGALVATGGTVLAYTMLVLRGGAVRDEQRIPAPLDATVMLTRFPDATVVFPRPAVANEVAAR